MLFIVNLNIKDSIFK